MEPRVSEMSNLPPLPATMETADSIIAVCMNADANNGLVTSKARLPALSNRTHDFVMLVYMCLSCVGNDGGLLLVA